MSVRVRVHEGAIQSMFVPGGQIDRFGRQKVSASITRSVRTFAAQHARTGRLAGSFRTTSRVRKFEVEFSVYSTVDHARYLEEGTAGASGPVTLYADVLPAKSHPRAGGYQKYIGAQVWSPRGTKATRFMSRALQEALHEHGLV